jgi:aryl-alcohol dehydrogenase-like predicted oxidoreductase
MRKLSLWDDGEQVSSLCLGTMNFGTRVVEADAFKLLDIYVEAGGGFLDTANCYAFWADNGSGGESETVIGKWLKARKNRDRMFIATKVGWKYEGVEVGLEGEKIVRECEKSLQRLGIDCIDLYYAHNDDYNTGVNTPLEESLGAFDKLVKQGKVRHLAASNYQSWRLERALHVSERHNWTPFRCLQQRYTYLRPRPGGDFGVQLYAWRDVIDLLRDRGMRLLAYSPLLSGAYTNPKKSMHAQHAGPDTDARLVALNRVAKEKQATANQIVYAWMLHSQPAVLPLIGCSSEQQLRENLGALDVSLADQDMEHLNSAGG